jgi:transposase-like protein
MVSRIKYKEAIGLQAKRGRPSIGRVPTREDLLRIYVREKKSIREVSDELGCSKDMVSRGLKAYGIKARTNIRRSGLRKYGMRALKSAAKERGIRKVARELCVNPSTLSRFLRSKINR